MLPCLSLGLLLLLGLHLGAQQCVESEAVALSDSVLMLTTEGLAPPRQCLAAQRLSGGEAALLQQQVDEVVDADERVLMPIAEGLAPPRQCLAAKRLSGGEVALLEQQVHKAVDADERVQMPIAEGLAPPRQ
eukprot:scaffold47344_cov62-Phaeocystis_antarctica.AAC.3